LTTSVGTHALRITHPKYRDFVRFVDVPFEHLETLDVELRAFPVIEDRMRGAPVGPRPWYQSGWVVAGFATTLVVLTAILVATAGKPPPRDDEVTVHPPR